MKEKINEKTYFLPPEKILTSLKFFNFLFSSPNELSRDGRFMRWLKSRKQKKYLNRNKMSLFYDRKECYTWHGDVPYVLLNWFRTFFSWKLPDLTPSEDQSREQFSSTWNPNRHFYSRWNCISRILKNLLRRKTSLLETFFYQDM